MHSIAKQDRHFLTHKKSNVWITVNSYFTVIILFWPVRSSLQKLKSRGLQQLLLLDRAGINPLQESACGSRIKCGRSWSTSLSRRSVWHEIYPSVSQNTKFWIIAQFQTARHFRQSLFCCFEIVEDISRSLLGFMEAHCGASRPGSRNGDLMDS